MSTTGVISFPRTQTHGRMLSHPNRLPSRVAPLQLADGREVDAREWRGGHDHPWMLTGLSTGIYFTRVTSEGRELARGRLVVTR